MATNMTFVDYVTPVPADWLNNVNTFVNTPYPQPPTVPGQNAFFQVLENGVIIGPDKQRFIARGVCMFSYLLCSFEARTNYLYRNPFEVPPGQLPPPPLSLPTYYARLGWVNEAYVEAQIAHASSLGINLIRLGCEAACQFATAYYVDPVDGLTYPPDMVMMDFIIQTAATYNMVVQLQMENDNVLTSDNNNFMTFLANRYWNQWNVWINPANEPGGLANGGSNVNNPVYWNSRISPAVTALRTQIVGQPTGTIFRNPIAIDPTFYAYNISNITTYLNAAPFSTDPNLLLNIHVYGQTGQTNWRFTQLEGAAYSDWVQYIGTYPMMIGETGINNFGFNFDPELGPSSDPTEFANQQLFQADFLTWCNEEVTAGNLGGVIGEMWKAVFDSVDPPAGTITYDNNTMLLSNNTLTTWGNIFNRYSLAPPLSGNPINRLAAGLSGQGQITGTAMGTPVFQAEGLHGVKAAALFIMQGASDAYMGFYNRNLPGITGQIVGDGSSGVSYVTTSDYRLKVNPTTIKDSEAIEKVMKLNPVNAGWKSTPDRAPESMFLAHELQDVLPHVVHGEKDAVAENGEIIPQMVDYSKLVPILAAGLQAALREIEVLKEKLK